MWLPRHWVNGDEVWPSHPAEEWPVIRQSECRNCDTPHLLKQEVVNPRRTLVPRPLSIDQVGSVGVEGLVLS